MDKIAGVVTIACALWHNRNEVRLGGARKSGMAIVNWAAQYIEEYKAAIKENDALVTWSEERQVWLPLLTNCFSVNVDGVVFSKEKATGVGSDYLGRYGKT